MFANDEALNEKHYGAGEVKTLIKKGTLAYGDNKDMQQPFLRRCKNVCRLSKTSGPNRIARG